MFSAIAGFWENLLLFFSLVRDYWRGNYRHVSWLSFAGIALTLLYMVSPLDLMTDAVPVIGWLDDVAVLLLCLKLIKPDLERYRKYKKSNDEL